MKTWLIVSVIVLLVGTFGFLGMNYYEKINECTLEINIDEFLLECIPKQCYWGTSVFWCLKGWVDKPLIILYPNSDTHVQVKLEYASWFSATYPRYDVLKRWWSVLAHSDWTLRDFGTDQDTYGLFWEGNSVNSSLFDLSKWFMVRGADIRDFLYNKLTEIGLNTKEKSDFIMYWYPKLQKYPYVQLTFAGKDYTDLAKLDITPKPDSLLRVFMVAKPLIENKIIPEQKIQKFERKWFSVVEWGGTIVE